MNRTIQTNVGTWKGTPAGFDFDGNKDGDITHSFQANWDTWGSREDCLDHFREKTWITPPDIDAIGQLWDEFLGTKTVAVRSTKELGEINPKALSDALAIALGEQLGGQFGVTLTKLEHTKPGAVDPSLVLQFHVTDESWALRMVERMHTDDVETERTPGFQTEVK